MTRIRFLTAQLLRFGWTEARSCLFAGFLFAGLLVSSLVPLPLPRYDALLLYGIVLTFAFWAVGLETGREVAVIAAFHLIGLAFELVKVRLGSWTYPGHAFTKVGGVPLYSGFLYAAVGSYVCQAWRLFELRVSNYRMYPTALVALAIYVNFVTHHWIVDLRLPLAAALLAVTWRTRVHLTVGDRRYRMPLALSLVLIGFFLWVAENFATLLGAWEYPDQHDVWQLVHPAKLGAWALLVSVSFVLVAALQATQGRLREPQRSRSGSPSTSQTDRHTTTVS